ncbi:MAG: hypothetical protein EPO26_18860 [Chloroflexota bacterium]|nr:MAG: hypothetical protein EPO26_18860 [Chloroflexota bacterium]
MRDTRLVFIDGIPGSGKTTTARSVDAVLAQRSVEVRCFLEEHPDHPLHVGGPLHPSGRTTGAAFFGRYTVDSFVDESLRRWRTFVNAAERADAVHVVESYPYQSAARVLLQMDASTDRIREYAAAVEQIVNVLRPVVIYFDRRDVAGALRAISEQRGPEWTTYAVQLVTDCPYGRRRELHDLEGALVFMSAYKAVMDDLLGDSRLLAQKLGDCAGRWEACYQQIWAFLEI